MRISYSDTERVFSLCTEHSLYLFRVGPCGYLEHLYYGAPLPDRDPARFALHGGFSAFEPFDPDYFDRTGEKYAPDLVMMEYPGAGRGDFHLPAISVRGADGFSSVDLRYVSHRIFKGKHHPAGQPALRCPDDAACETLAVLLRDEARGVSVELYYTVFADFDVIVRSVSVHNDGTEAITLDDCLSLCVDFPSAAFDFIHLYGRWSKERTAERVPLHHGMQSIVSRRGTSSHEHNPFFALAARGTDETHGEVYGFQLLYSGGFAATAEVDGLDRTRAAIGIAPDTFSWVLEGGCSFDSPEALTVYSSCGIGSMSRMLHRLFRTHLLPPAWQGRRRPLLVNSWEACRFAIDEETMLGFADAAAALGFEMVVMDDGWFGKRCSDRSSLGDWIVNEEKLPQGLCALSDGIHARGLGFGIWFEPEVVSPDSDLYRAHPDYALAIPQQRGMLSRCQYVLDLSRAEVVDYLFDAMAKIIRAGKIDYVKWDFNRSLTDVGSVALDGRHAGELYHRFVLGTYSLLDRLTRAFPQVLFESCSGGGGRFDAGMLYYSPQIWTSDNTDPIERLSIQFGTSLCYPPQTMTAHVSTNTRASLRTRADVAMFGVFGYELDVRKLTPAETEEIRAEVKRYHDSEALTREGDLFRLIPPSDPFHCAWMFVNPDRSRALLTLVTVRQDPCHRFRLRLEGLCADRLYKTVSEEPSLCGLSVSGAFLMQVGLDCSAVGGGDLSTLTVTLEAADA